MILSRSSKSVLVVAVTLILSLLAVPSDAAVKQSVSMKPVPASLVAGQQITLSGKTTGSLKGAKVKIQIKQGKKWKTVKTVKSKKKGGKWSAKIKAPTSTPALSIRAISGNKKTKVQSTAVVAPLNLVAAGPGTRILGVDISRWQNIGEAIDFSRMAGAGVAYAFIKGSDGLASEDALAVPHVTAWAPAAKAAGILVGYYHFARIPVTADSNVIVADAQAQAGHAAARLAALGGYDDRTLPYVLDVEGVDPSISDEMVTLWTFTWLDTMQAATARTPIMYSYRSFLATRYLQDANTVAKFRNYHLWLAQLGNPADPAVQVGQGLSGKPCYETAWKQSDCSYVWTFWQYSHTGDREVYGIPWRPRSGDCPADVTMCRPGRDTGRNHLDLNLFNGTAADLSALVSGSWVRSAAEYR
ncbi:MAG: glycoside hydrolase family 25 protein [Candidatus Nanopelagicales bacterium]